MTFPTRLDLTVLMNLRDDTDIIELDGTTSDYVIRNPAGMLASTSFTVEFWMETLDSGKAGTPFSYAVSGDFQEIEIKDYADFQVTVNGTSADTNVAVNDGAPHHIALSWDYTDGASVFYVDGKPRWSGTLGVGSLATSGAFVLGQEQGSVGGSFVAGSAFLGKIYDFRMWKAVRTEAQIFDNMNLRLSGSETDLRYYWKLDDGAGTTAEDSTSNNFDGTLSSSGLWTTSETPFFTDITDDIEPSTLTMGSTLGKAVDTCQFSVRTWSGEAPREWDEIVIIDDAERIFGGFATSINESEDADISTKFAIGGSDYGIYLDYVLVKDEFASTDDQTMILSLVSSSAEWIGTDNVELLKAYDRYRINRKTLRVVLNVFADDAGGDWYVSPYKELYYFATLDALAPYNISDAPDLSTTYPCHGLVEHRGGSGIVNRIEVVGGWYLSPDTTFILQGTGEDNRVLLPFRMYHPDGETDILVWRNDWVDGKNYCENPSFEVNVTDFWTATPTNCSLAQSSGWSYGGVDSCLVTIDTGETTCAIWSDAPSNLDAGDTISISCVVKNITGGTAQFRIGIYDGASWDYSGWNELADTVEERVYWTADINTGGGAFIIEGQNMAGGETFYFDSVSIEKYPYVTAYFDGDYAECTWDGTSHNSQTTRAATPESAFWIAITPKLGHVEQADYGSECLHYFQEQVLEALFPWPNIENAVKVEAQYEIPLRTRLRDYESFDFYKMWFDDYISDPDITDKASARNRAKAEMAERSMGNLALTCHVREPGLRAGQRIALDNTQFDIDDEFVIQRVSAQVNINGRVDYSLSLGVWNDDLIDVLLQITRDTRKPPPWREDEVLDEVIDYLEILEFSEVTYPPTIAGGTYYWAEAGTGLEDLYWDYGNWM